MHIDNYGQPIFTENDICELYLADPSRIINNMLTDKEIKFSDILELKDVPKTILYENPKLSIEDFDKKSYTNWLMPDSYKDMDIAKYVLELCQTDEELQRVGQELLLFQERNMFNLLRYLKYLVDTMRKHNVIWGVGRGSSVASFVLFLLGVHRINSLYYDLSINEFLK